MSYKLLALFMLIISTSSAFTGVKSLAIYTVGDLSKKEALIVRSMLVTAKQAKSEKAEIAEKKNKYSKEQLRDAKERYYTTLRTLVALKKELNKETYDNFEKLISLPPDNKHEKFFDAMLAEIDLLLKKP